MVDQDKLGKPWNSDELDAIVADYFSMLDAELSQRPYIKSHHNAALGEQIGRTAGSIEFKHQNISAVLEELGLPRISGYRPMRNYQAAIFDAIDRYLSSRSEVLYRQAPSPVLAAGEESQVFIDPPEPSPVTERLPGLTRLIRKFDPVERDFRNRQLGKAGEQFVVDVERKKLVDVGRPELARDVRWVSAEDGDGAGYDIRSFDSDGREKLIEVKTTNGAARTPFFLTRNEHDVAQTRLDSWQIYRVHLFSQSPRIFTIRPPLESVLRLRPEAWRASLK
jgi:hypothetical protein